MSKLYLIDGHSMAYRAFYAISSLTTSRGEPTNAIYGFTIMLLKILKEEMPDYLCICFDSKTPTFRHNIYPKYKAHRERMPEEMHIQIPLIFEAIKHLGCFSASLDGYEADDLIASCVKRFENDVDEIFILTQDKDMFSLISEKTRVVCCKKGVIEKTIFDPLKTIEKFGVPPESILDLLSLIGDSSDNIPGAKGIGEKTGVELIKKYESLENILKKPEIIEEQKIRTLIEKEKGMIELSRELVCLKDDLPLNFSLSDLKIKTMDKKSLLSLFLELEFKTLIKEMSLKEEKEREMLPFSLISTEEGISLFLKENKLIISDGSNSFFSSFDEAKTLLEDKNIEKIGFDLKSLIILFKKQGINLNGGLFDIMIASYLLNPGLKQNIDDIFIRNLPNETPDAMGIFKLKGKLEKKLKEEGLFGVFEELEMPLVNVLSEMEASGIMVDKKYLVEFGGELNEKISLLSEKIYSFAGEFNLNSPKQLSFILFEKLNLPIIKRGKTGPSTDEEVLVSLSKLHPLPKLILDYRELAKLKSTYTDGIIPLIGEDGRVHTSFNQTITATGRLSSSNPNLQNIPIRTEVGKKIRRAFVASSSNVFLKADYSQIELRILAHISKDKALISSFIAGEDIHSNTASEIYGSSKITEEMRRQAKTINFGIVYGMSAYGLSKELGISPNNAQEMIDRYFILHPGVLMYIQETIQKARELGYVETLWKRKRFIPEILSKNKGIREFAERQAINMPIQGTCADLIKKAMIDVYKSLPSNCKLLLQVHDELLFEIPEKESSKIAPIVIESMKNAGKFDVPIEVNISIGKNWGEL
ncbi:MAG: DNA polymerase I [bacterium]